MRRAEESKAERDQALYRAAQGVLPPGTIARLLPGGWLKGYPNLPIQEEQGVDLVNDAVCLVLESTLNPGAGPLLMTKALFGSRALWVPARSLLRTARCA